MKAETTALAPANLYADAAFLDVIAATCHPGRDCCIRDFAVAGQVFRLLQVDGRTPLVRQTFIDLHEPLGAVPSGLRLPGLPRLPGVARAPEPFADFQARADGQGADGAPTVTWSAFATWADYLAFAHAGGYVVEDLRRGRRLRERVPDLAFAADDAAADVLATAFDWKGRRDRALSRIDLFADERHRHFFHALRERGLLRASTLRGGGQLLAIWLGAVYRGRWSGWVFAFNPDPALARYSLGQQLLHQMLEHGHGEGHVEFDFSIGAEPYKLKFATHVRPIGLAGQPRLDERALAAARQWLGRHPHLHDAARAVRRRLAPVADATARAA